MVTPCYQHLIPEIEAATLGARTLEGGSAAKGLNRGNW